MYLSKSVYFASFPALSLGDSLLSLSSVLPSSPGVPPETNGEGGERARKGRRQKRVEEPKDNASGSDWPAREIRADPRNKEGPGNIEQSGEGREGAAKEEASLVDRRKEEGTRRKRPASTAMTLQIVLGRL